MNASSARLDTLDILRRWPSARRGVGTDCFCGKDRPHAFRLRYHFTLTCFVIGHFYAHLRWPLASNGAAVRAGRYRAHAPLSARGRCDRVRGGGAHMQTGYFRPVDGQQAGAAACHHASRQRVIAIFDGPANIRSSHFFLGKAQAGGSLAHINSSSRRRAHGSRARRASSATSAALGVPWPACRRQR